MSLLSFFLDLILNLDKHLSFVIQYYGSWVYTLLFLIIFCETGLVITPFLPGDSLIFVAAAFAAQGSLNVWLLFILFCLAAILGDTINYLIGFMIGPQVFKRNIPLLKKEYLYRTQQFYEKHGGKTIILARFVPIIRTFAPFVAGISQMSYRKFLIYNVCGGIFWVALFVFGGYFFGNIPLVKENFTLAITFIIILSFVPLVIEFFYLKNENNNQNKNL